MKNAAQATARSWLNVRRCILPTRFISRRWTVLTLFLGLFAVAAAGAARGYKPRDVSCVLVDSPMCIRAGSAAAIHFQISNCTARTIKLRPRSFECDARLHGVPDELAPWESREIWLALNTTGKNGSHRFTAGISTDAEPRLVPVTADVKIHADWVVRHVVFGYVPVGVRVTRRVRIENVPATNLVRVGNPKQHGWSASLAAANDRSLEIELAVTLPRQAQGTADQRYGCDFSLFFAGDEVRRVQVLATGIVSANAGRSASVSAGPAFDDCSTTTELCRLSVRNNGF